MYHLHHKKFKTALNDCFVDITKIHSHNTKTKDNFNIFQTSRSNVNREKVSNL